MNADTLPAAPDAERSLLGAVLINGALLSRVTPILVPEDFAGDAHRLVYEACLALADRSDGIDLTTVQAELQRSGQLERAGGPAYLSGLVDRVPDVENVRSYAGIVREAALRRGVILQSRQTIREAVTAPDAARLIENAKCGLDALASPAAKITSAVVKCAADVTPERIEWFWNGRIPRGKPTIIEGVPGLGKSTVVLDLTARASRGNPFPDRAVSTVTTSLVLSAEDGAADTIRPRLEAAGADLSRVHLLSGVRRRDGTLGMFSLDGDLAALEEQILRVGAGLVVVDPLMAYFSSGVNSWKDQDIRRALGPVAALAERTGAAFLMVRHLTKGGAGVSAIDRGSGSVGIGGASRSTLLIAKDPQDAGRIVVAPVKSNVSALAVSLAFRLEGVPGTDVARVRWESGPCSLVAAELLEGADDDPERGRGAVAEAEDFLRDLLQHGPVPTTAGQKAAKDAGISLRTVQRAKKRLNVKSEKCAFTGGWAWALPKAATKEAMLPYQAELAALAAFASPKAATKEANVEESHSEDGQEIPIVLSKSAKSANLRDGSPVRERMQDLNNSKPHPEPPPVTGKHRSASVSGCVDGNHVAPSRDAITRVDTPDVSVLSSKPSVLTPWMQEYLDHSDDAEPMWGLS